LHGVATTRTESKHQLVIVRRRRDRGAASRRRPCRPSGSSATESSAH